MRYEIKMSGSGGQGTVLLGAMLAEAVASRPELFVSQTQAYDPAVRGGKAESNLVISNEEIDWPGPFRSDIILALSQEAYERSVPQINKEGLLIIDEDLVSKADWKKIIKIPFTEIARKKFHDERVVNTLSAGVLTGLCELIPQQAVKNALTANFKGKALELNLAAFSEGLEIAGAKLKAGFEHAEILEDSQI